MRTMQRLLLLAAGVTLSSAASAQSAADARYCERLVGLYRTYVNNPEDPKPAFQSPVASHENAIASCKAGNTAVGIPVLEQVLRDNKFTLPSRSEG
ncbi:MAG: hypothetical protein WCP68_07250 [Enhydrobacter sp.]